jgi:hypothetical protein
MAGGENSLEPTVEISAEDYPEILRIMESGGDVDTYLKSIGISDDVFEELHAEGG